MFFDLDIVVQPSQTTAAPSRLLSAETTFWCSSRTMSRSCAQKYSRPLSLLSRTKASFSTMPCVSSRVKGSSMATSFRSRMTLVQKRA